MKIKIILFALLGVSALAICWLSADLHRTKKHLTNAEELIEVQHEIIEKLGAMDAVNATINVEINNRATLGKVEAGDIEVIADQVIRYTRRELLNVDTLCKN